MLRTAGLIDVFPFKGGCPTGIKRKGAKLDVAGFGAFLHEKSTVRGPCISLYTEDPEWLKL